MRVLVTGGSGFVGSHATRALLADGHELTLVALPGDRLWRIADLQSRVRITRVDLRDATAVRRHVGDCAPDACLHLAWYVEPADYLHSVENLVALRYSLALIESLHAAGCRRFVGVGSCAEYQPIEGCLSEDAATRPTTIYAASKLACCSIGSLLAARRGMDFVWARLFYPYGPQENATRLPSAAIRALLRNETFKATDGRQVRDCLHCADVGRALAALVDRGAPGIYNVSSGTPVTVRQLLETIARLLARPELVEFGARPYNDFDPPFMCGDNTRLRTLEWSPRHDLASGLADLVASIAPTV
jgi:nucleoside-diphosphate-sugar epimerase